MRRFILPLILGLGALVGCEKAPTPAFPAAWLTTAGTQRGATNRVDAIAVSGAHDLHCPVEGISVRQLVLHSTVSRGPWTPLLGSTRIPLAEGCGKRAVYDVDCAATEERGRQECAVILLSIVATQPGVVGPAIVDAPLADARLRPSFAVSPERAVVP